MRLWRKLKSSVKDNPSGDAPRLRIQPAQASGSDGKARSWDMLSDAETETTARLSAVSNSDIARLSPLGHVTTDPDLAIDTLKLKPVSPKVPKVEDYTFTPLQHADSIRLLSLHPGETSAPLQISLAEVQWSDNPQYEALSYTWAMEDGDDTRSASVECDGKSIKSTKNCEAALRRLRKQNVGRVLWVDAICIDQENTHERGHQVGLMREIYSRATEVLIWLGESSKKTDKETGLPVSDIYLRHIGPMAEEMRQLETEQKPLTSSPLYLQILSESLTMLMTGKSGSLLRGLFDVHGRRWWERIWVIQEAVAAKSAIVICSQQTAQYSDLTKLYQALRKDYSSVAAARLRTRLGDSFNHLSVVRRASLEMTYSDLAEKTLRLLDMARPLKASDSRDKVFGIFGLSATIATILPAPDYTRTTSDVYIDVAIALLRHSRSLRFLTEVNVTSATSDRPSWVPDWSTPSVVGFSESTYKGYRAARNSKAKFDISSDHKQLWVSGKAIDCVEKLSIDSTTSYESSRIWQQVLDWQNSCRLGLSITEYPTGEPVREALWRTLCWNIDKSNPCPAPPEIGTCFEEWYPFLISGAEPKEIFKELETSEIRFHELIRHRRAPLCITAMGLLASVPYTTEVGDCIVILSGGRIPFVLRPVEDHYRLIGPCYHHGEGVMRGKVFPNHRRELEWFSIW